MREAEQPRWKDPEPGEDEFAAQWGGLADGGQACACPAPGLLLAAQTDALPEPAQSAVRSHLERCGMCRALARDLAAPELAGLTEESKASILAGIRKTAPRRGGAARNWGVWAAIPVAASIVAGFIYFKAPRPDIHQTAAPPAISAAPAERASALLEPTKPEVQLPAAALLFRGSEDGGAEALLKGMAAFRRDDYAEAARLLERAAKLHPEIAEAHFYLGVSLLFLGRNEEAGAALEAAETVAGDDLAREAAWYLAVAHYARGDREAAARWLKRLCGVAGARQDQACRASAELSP